MKVLSLVISIMCISTLSLFSQTEVKTYGKEGWSFNGGVSLFGPMISVTNSKSPSGEIYFNYHAFDWEKDENLINKPTSGGFQFGWNFFPTYSSPSRIKWLLGIGVGVLNERVGTTSAYRNQGWTGYWTYYEAHGGIRYFLSEKFSLTGSLGYMFYRNNSQTILKQHNISDVTESLIPLYFNLNLYYTF